jgi:hypothetical protein
VIAAAALVLGGCMGGIDSGTENNSNQNGNNNGNIGCSYFVDASPSQPEIGDLVTLEVIGTGSCSPTSYAWTVTTPDATPAALVLRNQGQQAELVPDRAGSYAVEVLVQDFREGARLAMRYLNVADPAGVWATYLLRLTPPAEVGAPRQQTVLQVRGGTPLDNQELVLAQGQTVVNALEGPSGGFAAYLRLVQRGFPLYQELHVPTSGAFALNLLPTAIYDVLVVPDEASLAPAFLEGLTAVDLADADTFTLDAGEGVLGYVLDASGLALVGAQVGLRGGDLSSSLGTAADIDGRFTLRARAGDYAMEVIPPAGSGLPEVVVAAPDAIAIQPGHLSTLTFRYGAVAVQEVDLRVVAGPEGSAVPVADARVTVEATGIANAGVLEAVDSVSGTQTFTAAGRVRVTAVTDAAGRLPRLRLPAAVFRVVVEPFGAVPAGFGTTVIPAVDLTAAPAGAVDLPLAAPARMLGAVVDEQGIPVSALRILAVTAEGLGSAVEAWTEADGQFSFPVVRGATYAVLLHAAPGAGTARLLLGGVVAEDDELELTGSGLAGELLLPAGLVVRGRVTYLGSAVPGVLIQGIPAQTGGDPVLGEAVTDAAGGFTLVLPDPGVAP